MVVERRLAADDDGGRKARGAFFTPPGLADFLAHWAVRTARDRVVDPSCGEAALLLAAGRRLRALGGGPALCGFDLHAPSLEVGRRALDEHGLASDLRCADFFDEPPARRFDVVVGNPPYIRYQSFSGGERIKAQQAVLAQGVRLSGLANAWAAFVVHASGFLGDEGRLALVLPAVLLSVNYAAPVRRFLLDRFRAVKLVMFEERVFPEVLEEVVLVLAEGRGSTAQFELFQVRDVAGLQSIAGMPDAEARAWTPLGAEDKWTEALLPRAVAGRYAALTAGDGFTPLSRWGSTDLGMVTGNNKYFTLTDAEVAELGLGPDELRRISPPGSRHLRGLGFTDRDFDEAARSGRRVHLFHPAADRPSPAARKYIVRGEQLAVDRAYKCSVRSPWWLVPGVRVPDLFLTYMNQDAPRLIANQASAAHLNSVHGVTLQPALRDLGVSLLPLAMLNSVTLLGAELLGRSYGGGLLKVEPREADRLPVPSPALLADAADDLRALQPQLAGVLQGGRLPEVARAVDEVLLARRLGLADSDTTSLADARAGMAARRAARAGKPR